MKKRENINPDLNKFKLVLEQLAESYKRFLETTDTTTSISKHSSWKQNKQRCKRKKTKNNYFTKLI